MALLINVEDLLRKRKVESNWIEFKKGWNSDRIYRYLCAFVNDFDNIGGDCILVGVEEESRVAKRLVIGIPTEQINTILKEIMHLINKIKLYNPPRTELLEIDGKNIIVIWCPYDTNRPYDVPEYVTSKNPTRKLKNVVAMLFCPIPEKFFPYTQVEIVIFPEGVFENPRNFKEVPPIRGTVPQMIEETMRYLRTMVIQLHIIKQTSSPSKRIYNYPEKALEEAITNAFYHRDYRSRTSIVVEVQPYEITISSATGPDRSIPMDAIKKGQRMVSRYYRNRCLGEFLKELSLTEGRNTGIPTIQRKLTHNGSPTASFETDEDRLSFLVRIPCHEGEEGVSSAFMTPEANDKEANNHDKENNKETENYDKELRQRNLSDIQVELIRI